MSTTPDADKLAEKRYVTVILRLVVDQRGRLVHGEVVDVEGRPQGRFARWTEMTRILLDWLRSQEGDSTPDCLQNSG